jgi:CRISPR/Cas system CSM-associated protein Csm2 small subunit
MSTRLRKNECFNTDMIHELYDNILRLKWDIENEDDTSISIDIKNNIYDKINRAQNNLETFDKTLGEIMKLASILENEDNSKNVNTLLEMIKELA